MRRKLLQTAALSIATALAVAVLVATAVPVVACSCVEPQPMSAYAGDPNQLVFTGIVQPPDGRGVPVRVTRWFQPPAPDAVVWLARGGFNGDGASCGTVMPMAFTEWIFVASRSETGELGVNLCTPHAAATDGTGRAMFADAVATFGQGQVVDPDPEPPASAVPADPAATVAWLAIAVAATAVIAAGIGLSLVRRRRREDPPASPWA